MIIAIVDDNSDNRKYLATLIKNNSEHTLVLSESGQSFLEYLKKEGSDTPDLVLLDIMLPGMSGFEVAEHIRGDSSTEDMTIIFITALTDRDSIKEAFDIGGDDYISKPVLKEELMGRINVHARLREYTGLISSQNKNLREEKDLLKKRGRELSGLYKTLKLMKEEESADNIIRAMADDIIPESLSRSEDVIVMVDFMGSIYVTEGMRDEPPGYTVKAPLKGRIGDYGSISAGYTSSSQLLLDMFQQKLIHAFANHLSLILDQRIAMMKKNINISILKKAIEKQSLEDGIVILDSENSVIFHNSHFFHLLGLDEKKYQTGDMNMITRDIVEKIKERKDLVRFVSAALKEDMEDETIIKMVSGDDIRLSIELLEEQGIVYGKIIILAAYTQ